MNTTFTTYAEKKANKFFNLLQRYTKSIRITAMLMLLVVGTSNAWAWDLPANGYIYFVKPSQWSTAQFMIGHSGYSIGYSMTSISNTRLYYYKTASWGGYGQSGFIDASNTWGGENNAIGDRKTWASHSADVYTSELIYSGNMYGLFTSTYKDTHDTDLSFSRGSSYTICNKTQTIGVQVWDGSAYSAPSTSPATVTASTYNLKSATASQSASTSFTAGATATETKTVSAAYSATVSLSYSNLANGYTFVGWYDSNDNEVGSSYEVTGTKTVYARFQENTYTVTVTNDGHGTTNPSGAQSNVGQVTGLDIEASPATNYEFVNWTITSGSGSFGSETSASTTFKPTSAATSQANFRSTATNSLTVVTGAGIASVTGSEDPVTLGNTYPITATHKTGYTFSTWTANPAANATFGSATTANTTVTVKNGSVIVTASATENMSTLTTSNSYTEGNPEYAAPTASVNSIGYETTAIVTATAAGNGYTFTGWTLTNCTRTDGGAADAISITVRSNGDGKAATVVANYAEDLTSTYYVQGDNAGPFSEGWNANQNTMMKKHSGNANSNDVYWEIDVPQSKVTPNDNQWEFKIYNAAGSDNNKKWLGWGSGDAYYWLTKENNNLTLSTSGSNNIRFKPYLAGKYTFHLNYDDSSKPTLTVTWPVYNQLRISAANPADATNTGEFDMTGSGTYTVTRSLNANTTYTFKIVYDSEWYGASSGNLTRASSSKTLSTSSDNLTLKTDVAGDYTFTFNSSNKNLSVTYPEAYKVTFSKGTGGKTVTAKVDGVAITSGDYVLKGKSVVFTQEANTGYTFSKWTDGSGNEISTATSYTCIVTADITIKAVFVENKASIDIKSSDDNKGTVSPTSAYVGVATKVEVTATPVDGYYTQTWTATAPAVSSATTGNTTTLSGNGTTDDDGTLVATFSERYQLISQHATNTLPGNNPYFTKQGDGSWACIVTLAANTEYSFKVKDYANNSAEYGNSVSDLQSCADWVKIWKDANSAIKFKSTQAGSYTIHIRWSGAEGISLTAPQVKITYPALPTTPAVTYIATRVYEEETINDWIAGDGAQATPYQFYNDETVRLTVTPLTEVAGLTAYYKVGETEQTANTFDLTTITTEVTPITITTYYKDSYGKTGTEATTTVYFQQVLTPEMVLLTTPGNEISLEKVQQGTNVEVSYSATYNGYTGNVTIKVNETTLTTTYNEKYATEYTPAQQVGILTFTATTEEVAGRVFEVRTEVAVYKLVTIKVNDPNSILSNVYMWRGDDAGAADVKTEWPGESFAQHFGTWRVFVVKYPYYDHFIVNGGSNENQTFNYEIPSENTCYQLSDNKVTQNEFTNYELTETNCPGDLAVSNIDNITLTKGEQKIVVPSIQVSLGNKLSDVTATVSSANTTIATAIMSGTNIIVYGHEVGSTTITVDYTLHEETVTKTFQVTVEKDTHITIQVKVPTEHGPDADRIGWWQNDKVYVRYWNGQNGGTDQKMNYLTQTDYHYYFEATIPLDDTGKTNFNIFYENRDEDWRYSTNASDVTEDGCYLVYNDGSGDRGLRREGDYCIEEADEYQVKIVMQNGKEYSSNSITNTSDILSFFAPGKDEVNYRSGVVMLYKNGNLHTTIDPEIFTESNVYTAQVNNDGTGLTNVAVYSGKFYIRTWGTDGDISNKGWYSIHDWTDSEKASRTFTEFVSREGEFYNHYWVQAMNSGGYDGKDVSACVANDYNDDLAGKLLQDKNTTETGDIKLGDTGITINVRFGYDPRTNYFGRAVLQGSADASYLNLHCDNAYADKECTKKLPYGNHTNNINNKFRDVSNWVYERDVYVNITNGTPSASLYVEAKSPHVGKDGKAVVYNHLLGYVTNEITGEESETPIQKTVIGSGTDNGVYKVRVVYDFKTNRIIAVWEIATDLTITTDQTVNADVLFIRKENENVPQITLSGNGEINNLKSLFFAIELHRGSTNKDERHEEQYMFTLPFDCVVGSISGVHGYMELWGIQRYRGDLRAQKGWYAETATFWEWMSPKDTLKAGEGYLLAFDKKNATWNEIEVDKTDANGDVIEGQKEIISMLRLYFPSIGSGFDLQQQSTQQLTVTYPNHPCTLTLHNRYLQDSNWKMIGTTSYNNATVKEYDKDNDPKYEELTEAPSFRYQYSYTFDNNNNRTSYNYNPEDGKTATYKSFYGYMVQFAGTITWNPINETVPEPLAAPRRAQAERSSITMRLELANTEGEKQDQTFVALDEDGTTTFDQNKDLNKVFNSGKPNIYTLSEGIPFAGNTLPMEEVIVPVGVKIATEGEYTFRMPDGTEGRVVELIDYEINTRTNLLLDDYTITLSAGSYENRFALHIQPEKDVTTGVGNVGDETKGIEKYLIDGKLIIRTAEGIFDAQGHRL